MSWNAVVAKKYDVGTHVVDGHVRTNQINGFISRTVNSYHDFSIDSCPSGFKILAKSDDNEIGDITSLFLGRVDVDPEREVPYT